MPDWLHPFGAGPDGYLLHPHQASGASADRTIGCTIRLLFDQRAAIVRHSSILTRIVKEEKNGVRARKPVQ